MKPCKYGHKNRLDSGRCRICNRNAVAKTYKEKQEKRKYALRGIARMVSKALREHGAIR